MNRNSFLYLVAVSFIFSCAPVPLATAKDAKKEESKKEGWFEFGWMGGDDKPILKMKLPPFMKRDYFCSEYRLIDGAHYCGTTDSMLSVQGSFKEDGRETVIDLSGTAYDFGREPRASGHTIGSEKKSTYGDYGRKGLIDYKEISLDGHKAYLLDVDDGRFTKNYLGWQYRRDVYYEYKYAHGDISLAIGVKNADGKTIKGLPQKEWSPRLRKYLEEIIGSVRFMRKVEE